MEPTEAAPTVGKTVFNDDGEEQGIAQELTSGGFVVSVGLDAGDIQRAAVGELGEAYLRWRCLECGEMGKIEQLCDRCPNTRGEKESLYYWTEN
ncbi:MAG: DUF7130 family rubredoxin-like protein [Halohasta sp.]